jgi:quercetin dioxygenase-like cupin family protein
VGRLEDLGDLQALKVWNGVIARTVEGERASLAVVELEPSSVVPEHSHENEQLGMVITGSVTFRVGSETRELGPGGTWRIPSNTPHSTRSRPSGPRWTDYTPARRLTVPSEPPESRGVFRLAPP